MQRELHLTAVDWCHHIATTCRDYRLSYGYTIIPGIINTQTWQAIFTLLRDLKLRPNASKDVRGASQEPGLPITDTNPAFEE